MVTTDDPASIALGTRQTNRRATLRRASVRSDQQRDLLPSPTVLRGRPHSHPGHDRWSGTEGAMDLQTVLIAMMAAYILGLLSAMIILRGGGHHY